ncbi:MAG: hypothetical protein DHS20C13_03200 [Thermodesulfobacteriota bacterium]|nr:MAG: hypothetical protein DHS20C13_03200 [Thermodesulfobacteriota bacterium]
MIKYIASLTLVLLFFTLISFSEENLTTSGSEVDVELGALRGEIDNINKDILTLLNKRAEVVLEIGKLKQENSMEIYDPAREKEIEKKLVELNTGPMPNESVIKIFREIISACRALQ